MTALDVLEVGDRIVATTHRRNLVAVWDGKQTYRIYRVVDGKWTELERFFDSSGDHTGALVRWMFSGSKADDLPVSGVNQRFCKYGHEAEDGD